MAKKFRQKKMQTGEYKTVPISDKKSLRVKLGSRIAGKGVGPENLSYRPIEKSRARIKTLQAILRGHYSQGITQYDTIKTEIISLRQAFAASVDKQDLYVLEHSRQDVIKMLLKSPTLFGGRIANLIALPSYDPSSKMPLEIVNKLGPVKVKGLNGKEQDYFIGALDTVPVGGNFYVSLVGADRNFFYFNEDSNMLINLTDLPAYAYEKAVEYISSDTFIDNAIKIIEAYDGFLQDAAKGVPENELMAKYAGTGQLFREHYDLSLRRSPVRTPSYQEVKEKLLAAGFPEEGIDAIVKSAMREGQGGGQTGQDSGGNRDNDRQKPPNPQKASRDYSSIGNKYLMENFTWRAEKSSERSEYETVREKIDAKYGYKSGPAIAAIMAESFISNVSPIDIGDALMGNPKDDLASSAAQHVREGINNTDTLNEMTRDSLKKVLTRFVNKYHFNYRVDDPVDTIRAIEKDSDIQKMFMNYTANYEYAGQPETEQKKN